MVGKWAERDTIKAYLAKGGTIYDMEKIVRKISPMQIKALDCWQVGGFKSKAKALREAGYRESVVDAPHKVFSSPAVIRELELRGFDEWGRRRPMTSEELTQIKPEQKPIFWDIKNTPKEVFQRLKEQLAEIPSAPSQRSKEDEERVSSAYIPYGGGADIFEGTQEQHQPIPNDDQYSSM
ncbi:MAG: hypothetical protein UX49_C0016G0019 [Candidatus Wolfebacteria bacterium GW2011_GWC2_46_275]|uniref:Uncharacterized protein n=1 Tax=Candidatus Wolfebacteria bacterium GW2011_GWB1_47_1 TaxID=1619007 RepID=A0A0G4ARK3_9BACT|nr:MAG: hypothetical protein UX70_C0001G0025 [Candidatus Wolfebacteria bacterium GW2011_GWB1_47_1]KKU36426.1 MAG: hypothetical protein UX49_C0016G0019 [Candidatus Wolfebacteria bacterium GW2011_GWC2_46_275]KKU41739.1 MAG: hypothetical protein UX58_C0006G0048 [Candidatus Wolfebacteria bacterium GW2011_GWB2_46_69]KKU53967.1 MAG: hypothetical protein UX76_C0007G0026 [Candidatus Wolfebacteria bacterium GW2011_GWC1_47_103]KKU72091.1 MAG: hypothetical protein UX96_C0017G0019 [Candidatus Wolfebacteria